MFDDFDDNEYEIERLERKIGYLNDYIENRQDKISERDREFFKIKRKLFESDEKFWARQSRERDHLQRMNDLDYDKIHEYLQEIQTLEAKIEALKNPNNNRKDE